MKVMAHRGYSGKYPENTMLAFEEDVYKRQGGYASDGLWNLSDLHKLGWIQ